MFKIEIDFACKTPKQEENETVYYPYVVAEIIQEHRWNTSDDKATGQNEHDYTPPPPPSDRKQCTTDDSARQPWTSEKIAKRPDDLRFISEHRLIATRAKNSETLSITVKLQMVQDKNREKQPNMAILLEQRAPPNHANFENRLFPKLYENRKRVEVVKKVLCGKYLDNTGKDI